MILIPAAAILNLTPQQLEAVVAHEIAHLRRYDDIANMFQTLVETLLFYHPAVWWVSRRIRHERELCCDDAAVAACGDPVCYARALTTLEKLRGLSPQLVLGAAEGSLTYRVRRILASGPAAERPSSLVGTLAFAVAIVCAFVNGNLIYAARPTHPVQVEYPEIAKKSGIQGTVPVEVKVESSGKVSSARALGGPSELRDAAVRKAAATAFVPEPAPSTKQVDVAFQLLAQNTAPKPPQNPPAESKNTGTLEGQVLSIAGAPLSKSTVSLFPAPQPLDSARPASTLKADSEGKFVFEGLAPGTYVVTADHPGYLTGTNGSRRTTQLLTGFSYLAVASGEHVTGVKVELTPYSTISGKVVDEDDDPVTRVAVAVMNVRYAQGRRQVVSLGGAQTDDRGDFKIPNMGPGQVYLSFEYYDPLSGSRKLKPGEIEEQYVTTFYPGVTDWRGATPVTVMAGVDVAAISVKLRKTAVYHLRGQVVGEVQGESQLRVFAASEIDGLSLRPTGVAQDGSFDIGGLIPGQYTLAVHGIRGLLAEQSVSVGNRDTNTTLRVGSPGALTGEIAIEAPAGTTPASPSGIRVALVSKAGRFETQAGNDGSFAIGGVRPGKYTVELAGGIAIGLPNGSYLKSISYGGADSIEGVDLTGGFGNPLKITISMGAVTVEGLVTVEQGEQLGTAEMLLIPDPLNLGRQWKYRRQAAGVGGRFSIRNVAPGDYYIFAVEQMDRFLQYDPDWFKIHQSHGMKITIKEGDHPEFTLKRTSVAQLKDDERTAGR